jgi:predicted MPP superfamily phosphohydrolase
MLSHKEGNLLSPLLRFGYYIMPFMLYLFLLILLFNIFLLFNLLLKWLPRSFLKSTSFKRKGLLTIIIGPALIVLYGSANFHYICVSDFTIEVPAKSSEQHNMSVAFISDFHIGDLTSIKFIERFIAKMESIDPDIILFGGDLLEGDRDDFRTSYIESLFRQLRASYGIYGVFGNHEHHGGRSSSKFYQNAGVKLLNDTALLIDGSFYLVGRKDARNTNRFSIDNLTKNLLDHYPILVLDHRPTDINSVSQSSVDIQLSGHTHHGQLFPFNLISKYIYEVSWGHKKIGNTHFFVTSGIQLWGPPVRTIGKSEIMLINVKFIQ